MNSEREIYEQLKKMAINEAIASSGRDSIARNVGFQIDKIIDLALTLSANRQGYKLVPVEPTETMLDAARRRQWDDLSSPYEDMDMLKYKAMIGAVE